MSLVERLKDIFTGKEVPVPKDEKAAADVGVPTVAVAYYNAANVADLIEHLFCEVHQETDGSGNATYKKVIWLDRYTMAMLMPKPFVNLMANPWLRWKNNYTSSVCRHLYDKGIAVKTTGGKFMFVRFQWSAQESSGITPPELVERVAQMPESVQYRFRRLSKYGPRIMEEWKENEKQLTGLDATMRLDS